MEDLLPVEIWQLIVNHCDAINQIRFCQITKFANMCLHVTDLYNMNRDILDRLNDDILKIYPFVVQLNAKNNFSITNVSWMRSLKFLDASFNCGIDDTGITDLDLIELNANSNPKITNVSWMCNLKKLYAFSGCGIDDAGIAGLDLTELDAHFNPKITNVSFMRNLKMLNALGSCGIDDVGITGLDLIRLNANYNPKITNVS
jgi:hypothetical protein